VCRWGGILTRNAYTSTGSRTQERCLPSAEITSPATQSIGPMGLCVPGQPLRIEQHSVGVDAGDGLPNVHDAPLDVAGVHLQPDLARIRLINGLGDRGLRRLLGMGIERSGADGHGPH